MLPLLALIPAGISIAFAYAGAVIQKKIEQRIDEGIVEGTNEFEKEFKNKIFALCKYSIINWLRNLLIIFSSYIVSITFHLNTDLLIAISVIMILGLYCFKGSAIGKHFILYYISYIKLNGFSLNSLNILSIFLKFIYQQAYDKVHKRVSQEVDENPVKSWVLRLFGKKNKKQIAEAIVVEGFRKQIHYIMGRLTFMCLGFCLYLFIYGSLFRFVVNINFNSWYEPFLWSFQTLYNFFN